MEPTADPIEPLVRLLAMLPFLGSADDADEQTKAVLRPLIERSVACLGEEMCSPACGTEFDPLTCPNCGTTAPSERSPYCSLMCKETAAFVRQLRSALAEGTIFDPERQMNFGQKWWSLQGGGFPRRQLMIPDKTIAKVIGRDGGVCSVCGAPATEVDHAGSG